MDAMCNMRDSIKTIDATFSLALKLTDLCANHSSVCLRSEESSVITIVKLAPLKTCKAGGGQQNYYSP